MKKTDSNLKIIESELKPKNKKVSEANSWYSSEYLNLLDVNNNKKDISDFCFDTQTGGFEIWKGLLTFYSEIYIKEINEFKNYFLNNCFINLTYKSATDENICFLNLNTIDEKLKNIDKSKNQIPKI